MVKHSLLIAVLHGTISRSLFAKLLRVVVTWVTEWEGTCLSATSIYLLIIFYFRSFTSNSNSRTSNDRNRRIQISSQWRLRKSNSYSISLFSRDFTAMSSSSFNPHAKFYAHSVSSELGLQMLKITLSKVEIWKIHPISWISYQYYKYHV